jgi:hypothetical protein
MIADEKLRVTVGDMGVFVHFKASNGQEAGLNILAMAKQSGLISAQTLLAWCRDRINEQPANVISPELRSELLEQADPGTLPQSDLEAASERYGNPEPITDAWIDEEEARAAEASAVSLPGDQFMKLLAVARNGLRPKVTY